MLLPESNSTTFFRRRHSNSVKVGHVLGVFKIMKYGCKFSGSPLMLLSMMKALSTVLLSTFTADQSVRILAQYNAGVSSLCIFRSHKSRRHFLWTSNLLPMQDSWSVFHAARQLGAWATIMVIVWSSKALTRRSYAIESSSAEGAAAVSSMTFPKPCLTVLRWALNRMLNVLKQAWPLNLRNCDVWAHNLWKRPYWLDRLPDQMLK